MSELQSKLIIVARPVTEVLGPTYNGTKILLQMYQKSNKRLLTFSIQINMNTN